MYYKQKNKTAINSQHMIADALFSLMKRKPFSEITVTEICKEAAIGRKTFYRNFELREDVIDFKLDQLFENYQTELSKLPESQYLYHHFTHIKRHSEYLISLFRSGMLPLATDKFSDVLLSIIPIWSEDSLEQEYYASFINAGLESIQRKWISRGFQESIEDVVSIAERIIRPKHI